MISLVEKPTTNLINEDQKVILYGISWQQYESFLSILGDDFPNLRLSYLEGCLEIMSTSTKHEELKTMIGMLIEAYLQETRTKFHAMGSATFRKEAKQRGLEPDECYCLGEKKQIPDLAIEVVLTSGSIDKLEIYRGLEVKEVWFWMNNQFLIYYLRNDEYENIQKSEILPNLDLELMAKYVQAENQFDAVIEYRELLRNTQK